MKSDIEKKKKINIHNYKDEDLDLAYDFSAKIIKELGELVKGLVLFGSTAKARSEHRPHDVDILVVIDDLSIVLTDEVIAAYRVIIEKIIYKTSMRIHVTTLKFTSFWEYARVSDPIVINILRDGVAIYDTGFFTPLQSLLYKGKIRPSLESIWVYYNRAPATLHNSKWHIKQAVIDLYWAIIDAAHAALMKIGQVPPSPEHAGDMINLHLAKKGLINKRHAKTADKYYVLMKKIIYGEIKEISGKEYDNYYKEAKQFVDDMKKFIESRKKS